MAGMVACSRASAPTSPTVDVPLQAGQQTVLFDAMGFTDMAVDAKNTLYLGGSLGIATLAPRADKPVPLEHGNLPVSTLAAAPDGTLYFVTLDNVVESLAPGSSAPDRLPFGELRQRSQIAVGKDGTAYLGDNQQGKLLTLAPGANSPSALPVEGVNGMGHMVVDANDNVFVSVMGKVVKIAKNATTVETVEGAPDNVGGLAVDAGGNLYATDIEANTVSRMPAGGGDWVQLPFSGIQSPTRIAVDDDGNVYVIAAIRDRGRQIIRLGAE
ncbi:hypothetical protein [Mycolicibacterium wolinskyi]|uniref:hypothetical protein n=1 Tax=Mycolicibacterium wolinskyi TaxID=59750 RepID=UPI001041FA3B|nr:hypothetical protein [Mycolicibacterium wolinskyi]